jgi:hypothetical protein
MRNRLIQFFLLGVCAVLLASCTAKPEPKDDAPPDKPVAQKTPPVQEAKADPREVKLFVDGMSEKLKLV